MQIEGVTLRLREIRHIPPYAYHGLECVFLLNGPVQAEYGGQVHEIAENHILVHNSGEIRAYQGEPGRMAIFLQLSQTFLRRSCADRLNRRIRCDSSAEGDQERYFKVKQFLPQLLLLSAREQSLEFRALLYQFLCMLYQDFGMEVEPDGLPQAGEAEGDLRRVLDYLDENCTQRISLSDAAGLVYMTPQAFSKYFKRKMGVTFLAYLSRLRAERAVTPLLYAEQSVDQVAANQGFANTKAFAVAFRQIYGMTPGAYRKAHRQVGEARCAAGEGRDYTAALSEDPGSLMAFLSSGSAHHAGMQPQPSGTYRIPVDRGGGAPAFSYFKLVVPEGGMSGAACSGTREQLETLQRQLGFVYVDLDRFDLSEFSKNTVFLRDGDFALGDCEIQDCIRYYRRLKLALYIQLDFSFLSSFYSGDLEAFYVKFDRFLSLLQAEPDGEAPYPTRFELACTGPGEAPGFPAFCRRICTALRRFPRFQLGLGIAQWMQEEADGAAALSVLEAPFQFAGVELQLKNTLPVGETDLRAFQMEQLSRRLDAVKALLKLGGRAELPLFLTRWNVLAGESSLEAGTFFRSAIILDTLTRLQKDVQGLAFPCCTQYVDQQWNRLGLFSWKRIKRPVFFVLDNMRRLRGELLFSGEQVIAVRRGLRDFAVAMLSPRYVNPTLSVDRYFVEHEHTEIGAALTGMEPGVYRIKRLTYDKDRSGVFERWREIGLSDYGDPDVLNRLESIIQPDLYLYEQQVDGTLALHADVTFNGIVLFEIKGAL